MPTLPEMVVVGMVTVIVLLFSRLPAMGDALGRTLERIENLLARRRPATPDPAQDPKNIKKD